MFHIYKHIVMLSAWEAMQCNDSTKLNTVLLFNIASLHIRWAEIFKKLYLYVRYIILLVQCLQEKDIFCFINIAYYILAWKRNHDSIKNWYKHDSIINTLKWLFLQNISSFHNGTIIYIMFEKFMRSGYIWRTNWIETVTLHRTRFIYGLFDGHCNHRYNSSMVNALII